LLGFRVADSCSNRPKWRLRWEDSATNRGGLRPGMGHIGQAAWLGDEDPPWLGDTFQGELDGQIMPPGRPGKFLSPFVRL